MEKINHPKCPEHNKIWDTIYPEKNKNLVKFECGCIMKKCGALIKR